MTASALTLLLALVAGLVRAAAAEPAHALVGLGPIGLDVELDPSQESLSAERLARRIHARLSEGAPALPLAPVGRDRLRLTVAVRPYGATTLRGFWLPFSGTYGIGPVRLSLERLTTVVGVPEPVRASVWPAERQAAGPWRESPAEILKLLDQTPAEFPDAYRRRLRPPRAGAGEGRPTLRHRSWDGPAGATSITTSSRSSAAHAPWRNCSQLKPTAVAWAASLIFSAASQAVAVFGPPPTNQKARRSAKRAASSSHDSWPSSRASMSGISWSWRRTPSLPPTVAASVARSVSAEV